MPSNNACQSPGHCLYFDQPARIWIVAYRSNALLAFGSGNVSAGSMGTGADSFPLESTLTPSIIGRPISAAKYCNRCRAIGLSG